jgi:hypothetical protein
MITVVIPGNVNYIYIYIDRYDWRRRKRRRWWWWRRECYEVVVVVVAEGVL